MIKLNLKNSIYENGIKTYKNKIKEISNSMEKFEIRGKNFLGWKDLPENIDKNEIQKIKKVVKRFLDNKVEVLVVVGIGGSFAGSKAGIEMILGEYPTNNKMKVIYVGESISSTNMYQKMEYIKNKNFAVNVISKSGTTTEPAMTFRILKKMLEDKMGDAYSEYIIATTDSKKGALLDIAVEKNYTTFVIPNNIGGRFSVLTPVGLLPLACAGVDIEKIIDGAKFANLKYKSSNLETNDAYAYAALRIILSKKYPVELMVQYEPQMKAFNEWWKQLAGESEGKEGKGLFPTSAVFTTDLHSLGQFIQEGSKILFETVITVKKPTHDVKNIFDKKNLDNLNYLQNRTFHDVNNSAFKATTKAHFETGKVPNIHIEIEKMDEFNFGELVIFFERAIAMTAYLLKVNPFDQPGVEVYKKNMFTILGKPE